MDTGDQQSYIQCLEEWEENDKTVIKRLEETEDTLTKQIGELKETIREPGGTLSASSSNSQGN